jgi:hypothetical protein
MHKKDATGLPRGADISLGEPTARIAPESDVLSPRFECVA